MRTNISIDDDDRNDDANSVAATAAGWWWCSVDNVAATVSCRTKFLFLNLFKNIYFLL